MLIVSGHLTVRPGAREDYLAGCVAVVELARQAQGCIDFAISADMVEPDRINIYERWDSREAVSAFRGSGPDADQQDAMLSASVCEYEVGEICRLS